VKNAVLLLVGLVCAPSLWAQENTFHLTVLGYRWTTNHNTLTFAWPGHANTSCDGRTDINGYVSGGNISASGTSSETCSTTYTPPTNQNIDIQTPVVFILAETERSRIVLTCTRNVRWSQCHGLNPGRFLGRNDKGHFEVQSFGKGNKEEWLRFNIIQQTAIMRQQSQALPAREAEPSIEAPKAAAVASDSGFPVRWKSMTNGIIRTLRFEGEYIYGEALLPEAAVKAGVFGLMDVKKDGDKYIGKINRRTVSPDGNKACSATLPIELTLVSPERIEGRWLVPPVNAKMDWGTCTFSSPAEWRTFTWIPVR
jgi:hypothetical protein